MKPQVVLGALALLIVPSLALPTTNFSFTGNFVKDDDKPSFQFVLNAPGVVTIRTWGYAGGTNAFGRVIPAGGFDPTIQFFDSTGLLFGLNQDGTCMQVAKDPVSGNCFDSYYSQPIPAGTYTLYLTEYDNQANGPFLSSVFSEDGQGNFTGPLFIGKPGSFISIDTTQRTSAWALDILGVDEAAQLGPLSGTPLPTLGFKGFAALTLLLSAAAFAALRRFA